MHKVTFHKTALIQVDIYIESYRTYHENVYQDSWIWSEDIIIDSYKKESIFRYDEILEIISNTLSNPIVSFTMNKSVIRWRTKILLVSFRDSWETRTITDIEIR
jgi:hypothetical protein